MRKVRCRNCGALSELPDYHGATLIVCPECEWHETHPARRAIARTMDQQASAAYHARQERLQAAGKLLDRVRALSPRTFEHFCAELFEQAGYEALPAEGGAYTFELRRGQQIAYVTCRHLSSDRRIEPDELENLAAALRHEGVDRGLFVTTGTFAPECEKLAIRADIELLDAEGLKDKISFADGERLEDWLAERTA